VRDEGYDNLNLLLPFVRWPQEIEWARECLTAAGSGAGPQPQVWMMVETPAVILRAQDFAPLVDGVSIGSNDLSQLILGVDRDNNAFARQDWDEDPAVREGLRWAIERYRGLGVPVGICGDAPSRSEDLLKELCGSGMTSISVSLDRVARLKELLGAGAAVPSAAPGGGPRS
jgi:pyruvate,water dikinase